MASTPKAGERAGRHARGSSSSSTPRLAAAATPRRSAAHEWEHASAEVGRIEIEIARIERAMDPPRV